MGAAGQMNRRLPIINGFVPVPDDQVLNPTTLTPEQVLSLIPGSRVVKIGEHESDTSFIELPAFDYAAPEDWYAILRAAARE
jgi:hypothetical protein